MTLILLPIDLKSAPRVATGARHLARADAQAGRQETSTTRSARSARQTQVLLNALRAKDLI